MDLDFAAVAGVGGAVGDDDDGDGDGDGDGDVDDENRVAKRRGNVNNMLSGGVARGDNVVRVNTTLRL